MIGDRRRSESTIRLVRAAKAGLLVTGLSAEAPERTRGSEPGALAESSRRLTLAVLAATLRVGGAAAFGEERDRMELRTA